MRFEVFDRFDNYLFALPDSDVMTAKHYSCLDGQDMLTVSTEVVLNKGYRLVWRDRRGRFHEHVVDCSTIGDGFGETYICQNSMVELYGTYIDHIRPSGGAAEVIAKTLDGTRWTTGAIDVAGHHEIVLYHTSAREAIAKVQETWGGELQSEIRVTRDRISERRVCLRTRLGQDNGKRFVYNKDLLNSYRTIQSDDPITRLYGFGRGVETGNGYGPRLDFSSVNNGLKYIEDPEATQVWGHLDANGNKVPHDGMVIFESCEDAEELLELTKEAFPALKEPQVSYEASVVDLEAMGFDHEGCDLGDTVSIIDLDHKPEIRVQGRVTAITDDLLSKERTITVGNYINDAGDLLANHQASVGSIERRASNWDVASSTPGTYLQQVIDGLNEQFQIGGSYIHFSFETGLTVSDVPLDENGRPTRTPAKAIQLKGGGFRIANTTDVNGDFEWRAFGTGDGFTAQEIITGILRGGSCWWNLDTGDVFFNHGTISSPGNSWNLDTGYLTFHTGRIEDATGLNYWDLDDGYFQTKQGHIGGFEITDHSIYSGDKDTLTSNNAGVYVGDDGISVGSGTYNMTMADGYLRGGSSSTVTGYVHLYSKVKRADNGQETGYGTRIAGQNHVSILTNGILGIGTYAAYNADATVTVGVTATVTYGESLTAGTRPTAQSVSKSIPTSLRTSSASVVTNVSSTGGTHCASFLQSLNHYNYSNGYVTSCVFNIGNLYKTTSTISYGTALNTSNVSFHNGYTNLGPSSYTLNRKKVGFTKGLLTTAVQNA